MAEQRTQADLIHELMEKIEEKNERIKELEKALTQKQNSTEQEEETEEEEEEDDAYFKTIKPKQVGFKERKNAIVQYLKDEDTDRQMASIPELIEQVFGKHCKNSNSPQYSAMRNAIQNDPRIISANSRDGRFQRYKVSPKIKGQ